MLETRFVSHIAERDVDLVVLEELTVSEEFRHWFAARVYGEPTYESAIGTWHSLSDTQLGESDLVFIFQTQGGQRGAILIENKVDAAPQPKQAERYRIRGDKGIEDSYWDTYITCIIAPSKYITGTNNTHLYDAQITYEELLAYFQSRSPIDERFRYKAQVFLEGIQKNRRGYKPQYSEAMTTFVQHYAGYVKGKYDYLHMQEAKSRPAGSTWINFWPTSVVRGQTELAHQMTAGFVKLYFHRRADDFEQLVAYYDSILPEGATIEKSGTKAVAISIEVPKLDPLETSFDEQSTSVDYALQQVAALNETLKTAPPP